MSKYNNLQTNLINNNEKSIERLIRLAVLNNKQSYNSAYRRYEPLISFGEIVQCEFVGIGSEHDDTHWGIVWSATHKAETAMIIPLTSVRKPENRAVFSIGFVENFVTSTTNTNIKESFVLLEKMQDVSKKRITQWQQRDISGNIVKDSKGNPKHVTIFNCKNSQGNISNAVERIKESMRLVFLKEQSLKDIIGKEIGKQLPVDITMHDAKYLHRPIVLQNNTIDTSNSSEYKITYRGLDEQTYSTIHCFYHKSITRDERNAAVYDLLSNDKTKISQAKTKISGWKSAFDLQKQDK